MRLSKRERILLTALFIIVFSFLFLNYYYFPLLNDIKELKAKHVEVAVQLEGAKQMKTLVETTKTELADLQKASFESENYLLSTFDEPKVLVYIDDNLGDNSSKASIQYSSITKNELYVYGDFTLNIKTSNYELKKILDNFENGDYFTTLTRLEIHEDTDNELLKADGVEGETVSNEEEYPLGVTIDLRFYAKNDLWDGQADYDFLGGNYRKTNIFE